MLQDSDKERDHERGESDREVAAGSDTRSRTGSESSDKEWYREQQRYSQVRRLSPDSDKMSPPYCTSCQCLSDPYLCVLGARSHWFDNSVSLKGN